MRVAAFMTREVCTATPDTPVLDVIRLILEHRHYGVPILDEEGILKGVVTVGDLVARESRPLQFLSKLSILDPYQVMDQYQRKYAQTMALSAGEIMRKNVPVVKQDDDVLKASELLADATISIVCVVEDKRLIGVLSRLDILRHLLKSREGGEAGTEA